MQLQQNERQLKLPEDDHRFPWGRVSFVVVVLLSIAVCATVWVYLGTDAGVFITILLTVFALLFGFLQLTPSHFSKKSNQSQYRRSSYKPLIFSPHPSPHCLMVQILLETKVFLTN